METPFIGTSSSQGVSAGTSMVSLDATSARAKVKPMIFSSADSYEEPASARETTVVPGDCVLAHVFKRTSLAAVYIPLWENRFSGFSMKHRRTRF